MLLDALVTRHWQPRYAVVALLAIAGAGVMVAKSGDLGGTWLRGCLLVQLSRSLLRRQASWPGAARERSSPATSRRRRPLRPALPWRLYSHRAHRRRHHRLDRCSPHAFPLVTLLYLGAIASGLAFFLRNLGATRVATGALAVLNNLKVPLTVACSLLFFGGTGPTSSARPRFRPPRRRALARRAQARLIGRLFRLRLGKPDSLPFAGIESV